MKVVQYVESNYPTRIKSVQLTFYDFFMMIQLIEEHFADVWNSWTHWNKARKIGLTVCAVYTYYEYRMYVCSCRHENGARLVLGLQRLKKKSKTNSCDRCYVRKKLNKVWILLPVSEMWRASWKRVFFIIGFFRHPFIDLSYCHRERENNSFPCQV